MHGIIFTPNKNTKRDKNTGKLRPDYTGAFKPEAQRFAEFWGMTWANIVKIDVDKSKKEMRRDVCNAIVESTKNGRKLRVIAFFCHGWKTGIQLGFDTKNVGVLAHVLKNRVVKNVVVPLYCCSTGRDSDSEISDDIDPGFVGGDGGFADVLRDMLCAETNAIRCRVVAHVTAGHTTLNPWVRYFEGANMPFGGTGGFWVVRPKGPLWRKWIRWLRGKDPKNLKRLVGNAYGFPFLSAEYIRDELINRKG
jgi:hypothetical protein